jgi:hypothetical protein
MGNNNSTQNFGSVYPKENEKARPGYYFNKGSKIYNGAPIELLPEEDSFRKLKYGYAKSNKRVFFKGVPIQDTIPNTFSIVSRGDVKNIINESDQLVKLNSVLGMDYSLNKKRLYYRGTRIYSEV